MALVRGTPGKTVSAKSQKGKKKTEASAMARRVSEILCRKAQEEFSLDITIIEDEATTLL